MGRIQLLDGRIIVKLALRRWIWRLNEVNLYEWLDA